MQRARGRRFLLSAFCRTLLLFALALLGACRPSASPPTLDDFAADYVRFALTFGQLSPKELDFYFGPAELRADAALVAAGRATLLQAIAERQSALANAPELAATTRGRLLLQRFEELAHLLEARPSSFAEQIQTLYGLQLHELDASTLAAARAELERLLPGSGDLLSRLVAWQREQFIEPERGRKVFERALGECRARTLAHWRLPRSENLSLQWQGKGGAAAWHSYQGGWRGTLAVEPRALTQVDAVLELACHEGYPGHQAQFLLFEQGGVALEESVVLTRSRQSVLREGAAMLAAELAFSAEERLVFEREVLYPLAGLAPENAERDLAIQQQLKILQGAIPSILAAFLDGKLNFTTARLKLENEALVGSAPDLLQYAIDYGSYLAGYTLQAEVLREELLASGALAAPATWEQLRHRLTARAAANDGLSSR